MKGIQKIEKEREERRAKMEEQKKAKLERKAEEAKPKPAPPPPKRPAEAAKPESKPKRIKLDEGEEASGAPPARDAGPPLPVDEMTELVAKLTSAIEASPPDEAAIAEVLDALEGSTMTMELLMTTGVGKVVNSLKKKSELAALAGRARALVEQWKKLQTGS